MMNETEIKKALHEGVLTFTYTKKDGTIREAKGTTKSDILSTNGASSRGGENKVKSAGYIAYYDLDKRSWRSFAANKLVSVIDYVCL